MEDIKHTYTIQWVGPFMSYDDYKNYLKSEETISPDLFSIYYFEAKIDGRYKKRRYLGIHKKNDGIDKRLNKSHEHFSQFVDAKELCIWIGSFSYYDYQKEGNIDIVETLFIQAYKDLLTENEKKKKSLPSESVCIINMWFDKNDHLKKYAKKTPEIFSDVLVYYHEENIFMKGNLSKMR
jgi:hypothetical protein